MTNRMELAMHRYLSCAALVVTLAGCQDIETANQPPKAVIELLIGGDVVDTSLPIPYEDSPIEAELSARSSEDPDGTIAKYEWRRTDVPAAIRNGMAPPSTDDDAGAVDDGNLPGPGEDIDPGNGREVDVTLELGSYRFTLYVTDDEGALGTPASVSFTVAIPPPYTPDAACVARYGSPSEMCEQCACAPPEEEGCLDLFDNCFNNADQAFADQCSAIIDCATEKGCVGAGCYAATLCMAEIDAASAAHGGPAMACNNGEPGANPCRAANRFGACTSMEMIEMTGRIGCGALCL